MALKSMANIRVRNLQLYYQNTCGIDFTGVRVNKYNLYGKSTSMCPF